MRALLLLSFLFLFPGWASAEDKDYEIISIYGNHVYDDDAILHEAGLGYDNSSFSTDEIHKRLIGTGLFSRVRVDRHGHHLDISVVEKMPAFALPYFSSSSDRKVFGVAAGLMGADEGATQLLARYQIGTGDHEASLYYRKDFALNSFALAVGVLDYESAQHDIYVGRDAVSSFNNWAINTNLGMGYHFSPDFVLELDTHLEWHRFEDSPGHITRGTQLSHRLFGELGALYEDEGLVSGYKIKPYIELTNPLGTFNFQQIGIFAETNVIRRGNFNWIVRPRVEQGYNLPRYQLFELGGPRLRGYPFQIFRSDRYSAVQNDVLLTAWNIGSKLILRPFYFADWAYIENGGRAGTGFGLNVYFRHVSVPAIQLAGGYGFRPGGFSIAAAIGPQL